mmetsp:Transcript_25682/g.35466  ORF Transcript_25682/g.35466 Transcript_25682/m.35466 type:complete len:544 (+) Transcript_25682:334-1965(+)|eukprot:CAMPEP_0196593406 /NCGR_PEP_ID=MMETSP1081-20130531/75542_1 /TAXON_ID=36882 /ORGANISM="Pyramimonas amylifera, Strain CCMP720" /LENGTH=543 /DNA_ID=CAMNT_0041917379 /DNA_START=334 /DNA_END=1965 /DNA_ORIENTATION=-
MVVLLDLDDSVLELILVLVPIMERSACRAVCSRMCSLLNRPDLWIHHLSEPFNEHRTLALREISRVNVVPHKLHLIQVTACLSDASPAVRRSALRCLHQLFFFSTTFVGGEACMPLIAARLQDLDPFVRAAAVHALGHFLSSTLALPLRNAGHYLLVDSGFGDEHRADHHNTRNEGGNEGGWAPEREKREELMLAVLGRLRDQCVGVRLTAKHVMEKVWMLIAGALTRQPQYQTPALWLRIDKKEAKEVGEEEKTLSVVPTPSPISSSSSSSSLQASGHLHHHHHHCRHHQPSPSPGPPPFLLRLLACSPRPALQTAAAALLASVPQLGPGPIEETVQEPGSGKRQGNLPTTTALANLLSPQHPCQVRACALEVLEVLDLLFMTPRLLMALEQISTNHKDAMEIQAGATRLLLCFQRSKAKNMEICHPSTLSQGHQSPPVSEKESSHPQRGSSQSPPRKMVRTESNSSSSSKWSTKKQKWIALPVQIHGVHRKRVVGPRMPCSFPSPSTLAEKRRWEECQGLLDHTDVTVRLGAQQALDRLRR